MPAIQDRRERYETAVARYFEAWNAGGEEELAEAVAAAWAADGGYTDPLADVRGHGEIAALIAPARKQFPGLAFHLVTAMDGHHDTAHFGWEPVDGAWRCAGRRVRRDHARRRGPYPERVRLPGPGAVGGGRTGAPGRPTVRR